MITELDRPAPPRRYDRSELRYIAQDLVAHDRGDAPTIPVNYDAWAQLVIEGAGHDLDQRGVEIARKMIEAGAKSGNIRARRALAAIEGRDTDVARIDAAMARPKVSFAGNRRVTKTAEIIVDYFDRGGYLDLTISELGQIVIDGPRKRIDPRAIELAEQRLRERADNGSTIAQALIEEIDTERALAA